MIRPLGAAILLLLSALASPARAAEPVTVAGGLDFPAGIAFGHDQTMYVTERPGRILSIRIDGRRDAVASVPTTTSGESGLLGITVAPDGRSLYFFATAPDGASNLVYRVAIAGGDPEIVVRDLPGGGYHNGGGVAFGDDGMLYVSNGERHDSSLSQNPQALGGKLYRYTPAGDVPGDNPFGDSPAFAIGLRNPFGLTIDPVSGNPFVTENGPTGHDEINRIVAGGNYGWPVISGTAPAGAETGSLPGDYQQPLLDYEQTIVPTGIAIADPRNARTEFAGDLFFATYGDQTIHRVRLNEARDEVVEDTIFYRSPTPVIALAWGPEGLYFSTPGSVRLFRLAAEPDLGGGRGSLPSEVPSPRLSLFGGDDDEGFPAVVLVIAAAVLVAAALAFAFWPRRGKP